MAALVSSISQDEGTKMPPITTVLSETDSPPKTPKENGDTKASFLPPFRSSKKKLKWSIDKNKNETSTESEKNKFNELKSKLTSKSASSFFSPKALINSTNNHDSEDDDSNKRDSIESKNSNHVDKVEKNDQRWSEDDSLLTTPQDKSLARQSTGSIVNFIEKVVQEILSTEKTYVNNLNEIIEGYLKCMRMKNCPISKQNVKHLFINVEKIYEFNREFLKFLENADEDPVEIADCFVRNEVDFQTYTEYCTNYPKSVEVLTECTRQREAAMFIQEIQMNLGHSLPLGSYLLKPVQRILKYHLLLQEMKKRFDKESDPDGFDVICDALHAMTGVAHYINEMKRQHEATLHVQEIQSQLSEFEGPDLTTYGNLVLEDTFRVLGTRTDRYLFLFEKILLITKKRERENGYTCKASVLLSNMMMTESLPKEPLAFQIIRFDNQKVSYPFMARSMDQKNKWTLALKRLLVESLVAEVPLKAKVLILGEGNVDEDDNSETESPRRTYSPPTLRRQSVKGSTSFSSSSSSQGSGNRRLTLDSDEVKEDENKSQQEGPVSPSDVFLIHNEQNEDDVPCDLPSITRLRTSSIDRDLPHPRHPDRDGRVKSLGATSSSPFDAPWMPKRSAYNEGLFSFDKCMSVSDLRSNLEDSNASDLSESDLDIAKELGDITENSKIHKTVREVARAFSFSEPFTDSPSHESSGLSSFKEGRGIDELLESIDRELDETRRTINSAQLLESAIRLKQIKPLQVQWPPPLKTPDEDVDELKRDHDSPRDRTDAATVGHFLPKTPPEPPPRSSISSPSSPTKNQDVGDGEEEERDLKAELAAFELRSPQFSKIITERHRTCSLDRHRGKKMFELSPRTNRFSTGDIVADEEAAEGHQTVREMARKYSKKVKDDKSPNSVQSRHNSETSSPIESPINKSPQLKVERVTKVKFDTNLQTSGVVRRRRRSGSRHKRSSWAHEDVKVDVDLLRLKIERPRSLHEMKPQKELIDIECDYCEYTDVLDEGLAPALLSGMEKNDVVVRGLVKHLVSKFGNEPEQDDGHRETRLL